MEGFDFIAPPETMQPPADSHTLEEAPHVAVPSSATTSQTSSNHQRGSWLPETPTPSGYTPTETHQLPLNPSIPPTCVVPCCPMTSGPRMTLERFCHLYNLPQHVQDCL
jgi:hypothetical protein